MVSEEKEQEEAAKREHRYDNLDDYSLGHSSPVPSIYEEMESNTQTYLSTGSHMVSGPAQGRLLTQFASMTRHGRILELGTFTGYATACLLEGASNVGRVLSSSGNNDSKEQNNESDDECESLSAAAAASGPYVLSMERDRRALNLAAAHMRVIEKHGFRGEDAAEAMCALRRRDSSGGHHDGGIDEVDDDVISVTVDGGIARCDLLRVTDALATVEAIATGDFRFDDGAEAMAPFDLVFVDADKTRLLEYVEACLTSDQLLNRGGLIVVDNVLWKGLVLEAGGGGDFVSSVGSDNVGTDSTDEDDVGYDEAGRAKTELLRKKKNRRARKLATTMHRFNTVVAKDDRAEVLLLPIRDGLSVIRKK